MRELTMKEEQNIQHDVLQYFTDICNKENLTFFLAYGTLLGAVREHGFIEWDDDIDIWMPRSDYNKFLEVANKYQDKRFFIQTFDTDPHCLATGLGRICVNNTLKWADEYKNADFHKGIYFDVFPLENGYGNWKDTYYCFKFKTYQALLHRKVIQNPTYSGKSIIKKIVNWVLYHTMSERTVRDKIRGIVGKYAYNSSGTTLIAFASAFAGKTKTIFDKALFANVVYMQFEDMDLPCPAEYDELLAYMYGLDYMTPAKTKPSYTPGKVLLEGKK